MIPFLHLEPLLQAPAGHPASEAEVIQLIWGAVNLNFCGFQGIPSLCCRVVDRKGICLEQGGCQEEAPCLLVQVKLCWANAGFPYFDSDSQIILKVVKLKQMLTRNAAQKNKRRPEAGI